jgi:16S rRNA C967 or C1407 C5-methylase (RsmB/RsmF family)
MDRIPARAAIDESVELAKQAGHRFASGMVNAVLRKLAGAPRVAYSEEGPAELALAEAHPAWMVERWASFYGLNAAAQSAATARPSRHNQFAWRVPLLKLNSPRPASSLSPVNCLPLPAPGFRRRALHSQPFTRAVSDFRTKARNWSRR